MVTDRIEREIVIAAPVRKVWAAVTTPEHLGTWLGDAGATIDLRPGGKLTSTWRDGEKTNTVHGVVEKVDEPHLFAYRWAGPHDTQLTQDNSTLVEFMFKDEGEQTRLTVVESGFSALALTEEEKEAHVADHTQGWKSELGELRDYAPTLP